MEENEASRDCSPPSSRNGFSSSGENAWREPITRSAPSRLLACSSMARSRLWPSEPMAVSAAMPRTMELEKSKRRFRLVRLSRQAIRHVHEDAKCFRKLGRAARSIAWLEFGRMSFARELARLWFHHRAAFEPNDPL